MGGDTEIQFVATEWPGGLIQFMAGNSIDVTGASGNHEFDPDTEEAPGPTVLFQASKDKTFTEVLRIE